MLIILEGLDKTGKTTLAEHLARRLHHLGGRAEVRHCEQPTRHPLIEYESDLDTYVPGTRDHVIYDRHCWGERVWPLIYDRPTQYTAEMHQHVEMYLESRGAVMVLCQSSPEWITRLLTRDDDPYPPPELVPRALDLFAEVKASSRLSRITWHDPGWGEDMEVVVERVISMAAQAAAEVRTAPTPHWVGRSRPSVLLVGDRPGPKVPGQGAVPFRPFGGTAGDYLMRALPPAWIALTNVTDGEGQPVPLTELLRFMRWPRVVALGRAASAGLRAAGVHHGVVPHPQWVRRFRYHDLERYTSAISRVSLSLGEEKPW